MKQIFINCINQLLGVDDPRVVIYAHTKREEIYRINIVKELVDEIVSILISEIKEILERAQSDEGYLCENFSEVVTRNDGAYIYDNDPTNPLTEKFTKILEIKDFDSISFIDDNIDEIDSLIYKLGSGEVFALIYRKFTSYDIFSQSKFAIFQDGTQFRRLSSKLLILDYRIEAIYFSSTKKIYITDDRDISNNRALTKYIKDFAINSIKSLIDDSTTTEFERLDNTISSDLTFARYLNRLTSNPHFKELNEEQKILEIQHLLLKSSESSTTQEGDDKET